MTLTELSDLNDYQLRQVADGCFLTLPRVMEAARKLLEERESDGPDQP